jgi:hypothetical protein
MELSEPIYLTPAYFFLGTAKLCNLTKITSLGAQTFRRHTKKVYIKFYESNGTQSFAIWKCYTMASHEGKKSKQGARRGRMMEERRNSCVAAGFPLHGAFFQDETRGRRTQLLERGSCRRERASEPDLHGGCLSSVDGGIHPRTQQRTTHTPSLHEFK